MHSYTALGMLAIAGSALAAPRPHWGGGYDGGNPHVVWETAVVTVIVGPDGKPIDAAAPTPAPEATQGYNYGPPPAQPAPTSVVVETPEPSPEPSSSPEPSPEPTPEATPSPSSSPEPSPTPSPSAAPSNPPSSGGGYMDVVNKWRTKMGLPTFEHDATLESNALKTCQDGNGQMVHELNPGTFGQVLAPGDQNDFERVFVGGWLCERPDLPGLDGICSTMSDGWAYNGQTGHADILSSKDYTKCGCDWANGIWGCDVA